MAAFLVIKVILRTLFVFLNIAYAIPTYLLWMGILRPLLLHHPKLYNTVEGIGYSWLLHMVAFWSWTSGYLVAEAGDDISDLVDSECLVISNHQSTADVPMLMYLCTHDSKPCLGRNVCWIMDIMFKFTPFGLVSSVHGDFYIRQGRDTRQTQLVELQEHLHRVYIPRDRTWILLFPEGGFLYKRKEASQDYARKNGYPVLEHVTLPRIGAMLTIVRTLSSCPGSSPSLDTDDSNTEINNSTASCGSTGSLHSKKKKSLKWVIDVTIAYPEGMPLDLPSIIFGNREPCQTVLYLRRYKIEEVPRTEEELLHWSYDRWVEKDRLLSYFYKTGNFPEFPLTEGVTVRKIQEPRSLELNSTWCWLLHVLFFMSSCFQLGILCKVVLSVIDVISGS